MKKLLFVLIVALSASVASAEVEAIRFAPTRPTPAPAEAPPAAASPTAKPARDVKAKKHTKAHHKKKAAAPVQH